MPSSIRGNRANASFAWDILKSDGKLLVYPIMRIVMMVVLLGIMWTLIFDISLLKVGSDLSDLGKQIGQQNEGGDNSAAVQSDLTNVFGHMNFGWLLAFLVINALIGVVSVGALTAQALATVRSENRSVLYGYGRALLRLPQLVLWWIVTVVIGVLIQAIESHRAIGAIVAVILGAAWQILTFFSITAIMATGCGPIGAISHSKATIVDAWKKATGAAPSNMASLRRGFYVGGPLMLINVLLVLALVGLGWFDLRSITDGGHGISMGAFGALLGMLYIVGSFRSAIWAVVRATVYVWAEEGTVPEGVDESVMEHAFTDRKAVPAVS